MSSEQMQLLGAVPTLYFEVGGGILVFVVLLWVFLSRRKIKSERAVEEIHAPDPKTPVIPKKDLRSLLSKTQQALTAKLDALVLSTKKIDEDFFSGLEELLYTSDLGPKTVEKLLIAVRTKLTRGELADLEVVKQTLYTDILNILHGAPVAPSLSNHEGPWVILVVGVNGVGKTTSIGKLAQHYSNQQKKVLVVAGDTFRAAAEKQLAIWGERAQVQVYTSEQTKDPAAVAFQGIEKGIAEKMDVVIVDTAGRLHNQENLMEELKKVKRVAGKAQAGAPHETILVIDANSGQNARIQAQQFNEFLGLTSLIVTKLDGTAKGGVIVGIADEIQVGVQFIGTGEQLNDLERFSDTDFAKGLLNL